MMERLAALLPPPTPRPTRPPWRRMRMGTRPSVLAVLRLKAGKIAERGADKRLVALATCLRLHAQGVRRWSKVWSKEKVVAGAG